jgi:hypothetical protein
MDEIKIERLNTLQIKKGGLLNDIKTFTALLKQAKTELLDVNEEIVALKSEIES